MARTTIDFGIDLGTTNSCIAVRSAGKLDVIKDNEDRETLSSAVHINKSGHLIVGWQAKEKVGSDPGNAFCEFKLGMGTGRDYLFERSGRRMKPEELSAEVLKVLLAGVQHRTGERPEAAVITVPAAFELPQCEATREAAKLAGLKVSPLLQEPVAAAYAYGFQNQREGAFWLVYDFGGGTFDAAVIALQDGLIDVVAHAGDNDLGGKNIDWAIVEDLLIPQVAKQCRVTEFVRGNPKWQGAFAKLKGAAEEAKIQLSRVESADIRIDFLCQDDDGTPVEFEHTLTRLEVECLAAPLITRSINLCKQTLSSKRIGTSDIEKILLVGGPTRTPYLRHRLQEELKIPLEFGINPMTIVAQGAAYYASTLRSETAPKVPTAQGVFVLDLEGKRMGPDSEPLLGGKVLGTGTVDFRRYTIEFINITPALKWRSGKISLGPEGGFMATLSAERGRVNRFAIELRDSAGTLCKTEPDYWEYEVGLGFADQHLSNSLSIELINNEVLPIIVKSTALPARGRSLLKTSAHFVRGQAAPLLRIPVCEGKNTRADRNALIGELTVSGTDAMRDYPAGTEVEVTVEVDSSRQVIVKAWISLSGEAFETKLKLQGQTRRFTDDALESEVRKEISRFANLRRQGEETANQEASQVVQVIESESLVQEIERSLRAAKLNPDGYGGTCEESLRKLQVKLDELEALLEWPTLVQEAESELASIKALVREAGSPSDRDAMASLEQDMRRAMTAKETEVLRRKLGELGSLRWRLWMNHGPSLAELLQEIDQRQGILRDQRLAQQLLDQGRRAMHANNVPMLKGAVQQLLQLFPEDAPSPRPTFRGNLRK